MHNRTEHNITEYLYQPT